MNQKVFGQDLEPDINFIMDYTAFLEDLDKRLRQYFELHQEHIKCCIGCSECCENGDYPLSQAELEYLMQGYSKLKDSEKIKIQNNIKNIIKGGACPFLIDKKCSVYTYRPIICRVHGLAYLCEKEVVKVPYCVKDGKNYSKVYKNGEITINPIKENLDTKELINNYDFGEVRNLYDWIKV
jgi:Fe-S-cluster containining protein